MKKILLVGLVICTLFGLLIVAGCTKDGGIFIPILDQRWVNKADVDNEFFFFNYDLDENVSTFEGNENSSNGSQDNFSGSFNNHNISFTYKSNTATVSKRGKTYSGTINDASNVMNLNSNDLGNLVLEKK